MRQWSPCRSIITCEKATFSSKRSAPCVAAVVSSPSSDGSSPAPISPDGELTSDADDEVGDVGTLALEDRPKYKKFHRSLCKWLQRASPRPSWAWPKTYGSWAGLRLASTSVQLEILAQFFEESRLKPDTEAWAKQWVKAGNFCDQKVGRLGRVDEPFAVPKNPVC